MFNNHISSPHLSSAGNTGHMMLLVLLATLPGLAMLTWYFGWGTLINVCWASLVALASEALVLALRKRPLAFYLTDYSALVTAVLLGLALPPAAPWWLTLVAVSFAILIAKHLYGGMGHNPFNPAMVGYALVLISFPVEMTSWLAPKAIVLQDGQFPSFSDSLLRIFPFLGTPTVDAYTMATPLDVFKQPGTESMAQLWAGNPSLSPASWSAWQFVNIGFLLGGLYLIYRKVFIWNTPMSMLLALGLISTLFWLIDSEQYASPVVHLLGGATMLGAFFIATDPVTSATSDRGKLIFGAGIGILVYVIRTWGNYPDAIAFAVLLMNFAAPLIDHYIRPRTYGHQTSRRRAP